MSYVYALHQPSRYDRQRQCMVALDWSMAEEFGELKLVFPGVDRPPPIDRAAPVIKEAMAGFTADDKLLIAGDMDLVIFGAILAAKACNGQLTLLKWHGRDRRYFEVKFNNLLEIRDGKTEQ